MRENYNETYTLVTRLKLVHLIYTIATARGLYLWQVDFISVFLNSDNLFKVYIEQSKDFKKEEDKYI